MASPEFSLRCSRELRLARPQASASALASEEVSASPDLRPWPRGKVPVSPDLSLGLGRSHILARPQPWTDYATGDTSLPYP
jgi:hypothetical protein